MDTFFKESLPQKRDLYWKLVYDVTKILLKAGSYLFALGIMMLTSLNITETPALAQTWSLTKAQRQGYLNYYAPVILKRGDENNSKEGRDWLTNFDFDQDGNFSTNRTNWININQYVAAAASGTGAYSNWRIRPTLYTSIIEYMEGGSKSLILLYHVYNAADKDGQQIHDWERIEISIRGVAGTPGGGSEYVSYATVTRHKEHIMRRSYDSDLNFMQTSTGKHLLIWQADESNSDILPTETHGHELRFVTNPYYSIAGLINSVSAKAEVNINSKDEKKNVHYVFVPERSQDAINAFGARALSYATAPTLASRADNGNTVSWSQVKRITYELQDLADIFTTNWQNSNWYIHWLADTSVNILLESPIVNEIGQAEVSAGLQHFNTQSRDGFGSDGRDSIISKNWLYGAYSAELDPDATDSSDDFKAFEGLGVDSYGRSRGAASGYYNSHNAFWWQHDFFVHSGIIDTNSTREDGMWLTGAWYTQANGGFDGRWVQLFDDRPGQESYSPPTPPSPLSLTINYPANLCTDTFLIRAVATGGQAPYNFTWTNADPISAANDPNNRAYVYSYTPATVTVQDANGQTFTANIYAVPNCNGGQIP